MQIWAIMISFGITVAGASWTVTVLCEFSAIVCGVFLLVRRLEMFGCSEEDEDYVVNKLIVPFRFRASYLELHIGFKICVF